MGGEELGAGHMHIAQVPGGAGGVSSAYSTPALRSSARTRSMNGPSRAAAFPRTPATNPAETFTPANAATSWRHGRRAGDGRRPPAPPSRAPPARTGQAGHLRRGQPSVTAPQPGHSFATTWYSVTTGGGGGRGLEHLPPHTPVTASIRQVRAAGPARRRDAFHPLIGVIGLAQRPGRCPRLLTWPASRSAPQRPVLRLLLIRAVGGRRLR